MVADNPLEEVRREIAKVLAPFTGGAQADAAEAVLRRLDPMSVGFFCDADYSVGLPPYHGDRCEPLHSADVPLWVMRGLAR